MNNESPHINVMGEATIDVFAFLNLEEMVERVIDDIFREMIALPVEREYSEAAFSGPLLTSTIEFSGVIRGQVHLHTTMLFAQQITATLSGLPADAIEDELAADTIGEVTNMVSGNLHTDISNSGLDCELRVPKVTHAEVVTPPEHQEGQRLIFRHENHLLQITLCLNERS